MNVQGADLASLNIRYIIPLDDYYSQTDEKTRQMAGIWVNGTEHLYKLALFLLDQRGSMSFDEAQNFIDQMYAYLTANERLAVSTVVWVIAGILNRELIPLLHTSGTTIQQINLVSIQEQIMGDNTCVNGIFVFNFQSTANPENFRTIHPVGRIGPGVGFTAPYPIY